MALLPSSFRLARGAAISNACTRARDWAECALNLAFPWQKSAEAEPVRIEAPFCRQCGYPYPALAANDTTFVCAGCADRKWYFKWARSGYRTDGQVLESIIGFKYGDQYYRRAQLVKWLDEVYALYAKSGEWNGLVPVPLYHRRHRERGFNHARDMADGLATHSKIPVLDCLYRYRETTSQARLSRVARWENMAGAFRLKRGFDVKGQNLLVIDDVFTTGATVNACAQALAQAGAAQVAVLTVARS